MHPTINQPHLLSQEPETKVIIDCKCFNQSKENDSKTKNYSYCTVMGINEYEIDVPDEIDQSQREGRLSVAEGGGNGQPMEEVK